MFSVCRPPVASQESIQRVDEKLRRFDQKLKDAEKDYQSQLAAEGLLFVSETTDDFSGNFCS